MTRFGIGTGKRTQFPRAIIRGLFLVLVICAACPRAIVAASVAVPEATAPVQQLTTTTDSLLRRVVTQQDSLLQQGRAAQAAQAAAESRNNWRYFWSALAQSLATVATLVFTVTLVVAQLATRYGLRMGRRVLRWQNLAKLGFFLLTTALCLMAVHHDTAIVNVIVIAMSAACAVLLVLHLNGMKRELSLDRALVEVQGETRAALRLGDVRKAQDNIVVVEGVAHGAFTQLDDFTLMEAVRCLLRIAAAAEVDARASQESRSQRHYATRSFASEVRNRLRRLPFSIAQNQQAVMSVVEAAASTMHEYEAKLLSENVHYVMEMLADAVGMLVWPRDETALVGYFDVLRRHVVTSIREGLVDDGNRAGKAVQTLTSTAERVLTDAVKRGSGDVDKGKAWLALARLCADGASLSSSGSTPQGEAADAYASAGCRLLQPRDTLRLPPDETVHEGFLLVCGGINDAVAHLTDHSSRMPRAPWYGPYGPAQQTEADTLLNLLWLFVKYRKPILRDATLESLWRGAAPSATDDVRLWAMLNAVNDKRLTALVKSDTGNYTFIAALRSVVGPCHNSQEQAAKAAGILVCIGRAARGGDLGFRDRLFHIADELLKSPTAQRVPEVVYCWFVLGASWCEAPDGDQNLNRLDTVRQELSGFLKPSLKSDYHQVVMARVEEELHDLLPALHTFANRVVQ